MRPGHAADRVLVELDDIGDGIVIRDRDAADNVGVAADVLRRRVDDDVGAECQRLLEVGRGERVVNGDELAFAASATTAAMSISLSSGLVGVSIQNNFVFGRIAARTASMSLMSTYVNERP